MFQFLAKFFSGPSTGNPRRRTRLSVDAMEDRFCPAGVANPGVIRGFNPQPDPPVVAAVIRTDVVVNPGEARGFNPQPDPPTGIPGTGGWTPGVTRAIISIN